MTFGKKKQAERFQARIYDRLPDVENKPEFFGDQVVIDEGENIVRFEPKLLLNALSLGVGDLVELVRTHDGFPIPSHVECPPFGLMVNLGLIPAELSECVLEFSSRSIREDVLKIYPGLSAYPMISNSDAHYISDIGRVYTEFRSSSGSIASLYGSAQRGATVIRREGISMMVEQRTGLT